VGLQKRRGGTKKNRLATGLKRSQKEAVQKNKAGPQQGTTWTGHKKKNLGAAKNKHQHNRKPKAAQGGQGGLN